MVQRGMPNCSLAERKIEGLVAADVHTVRHQAGVCCTTPEVVAPHLQKPGHVLDRHAHQGQARLAVAITRSGAVHLHCIGVPALGRSGALHREASLLQGAHCKEA